MSEITAFDLLAAQINRIENKVDDLSRRMSERDGERRVGLWLFGTLSGAAGAVMAFVLNFLSRKL